MACIPVLLWELRKRIKMYWAFIGTIYLIILTWQDYKHNMLVDDRKNFFMLGASVILLEFFWHRWTYRLAIFGLVILFNYLFNKYNILGTGDVHSIIWIFLGMGLISIYALAVFVGVFIVINVIYHTIRKLVFKYNKALPYYGVILISYVTSCLISNLYTLRAT